MRTVTVWGFVVAPKGLETWFFSRTCQEDALSGRFDPFRKHLGLCEDVARGDYTSIRITPIARRCSTSGREIARSCRQPAGSPD